MLATKLKELEASLGGKLKVKQSNGKVNQGNDRFNWHDYADFYEKHFPKDPKVIVELGILRGTGLYIWRQLFPNARIIGLDIFPEQATMAPSDVEIYYFDQLTSDPSFLPEKIDVFIDDGLHTLSAQEATWKRLGDRCDVYFVEDIDKGKTLPFLTDQSGRIGVVK